MDKLSKDASAAIKAGMTYGQYMATKYPVKIIPPKQKEPSKPAPQKTVEMVCECCGKVIRRQDQRRQRFCDSRCKHRYCALHKEQSSAMVKTCGICGTEFEAANWKAKYCSDRCRRLAQAEGMKRFYERKKGARSKSTLP